MKKVNPNAPINVNEDVWFYRNKKTLNFIVWTKEMKGQSRQVAEFVIKKSLLKRYL